MSNSFANQFDIRNFGATVDQPATAAIEAAIAACEAAGGGTVVIPPGLFLTGPIRLRSRMALFLERGAELRFIPQFDLYRPVWTRWEGVECYAMAPLLFGNGLTDVAIEGHGVLNGSGEPWWQEVRRRRAAGQREPRSALEMELAALNPDYRTQSSGGGGREMQFLRPPLIQLFDCRRVRISGVRCVDPPFWNTHLVYCTDVTVDGVTFAGPHDAPNTDGLDIDSCRTVTVTNCRFDVGDDCLALKSGAGTDGVRVGRPTEQVVVSNCIMEHGHGAVVIGSETAGGIKNVVVSNCVFRGTERGIRIKTRRGRAGTIERLSFTSIVMEDVLAPFVINMFYRCGLRPDEADALSPEVQPITDSTPRIAAVEIGSISAAGVHASAGYVCGLPEQEISGLRIHDVDVELAGADLLPPSDAAMAEGAPQPTERGVFVQWAAGASIERVTVRAPKR